MHHLSQYGPQMGSDGDDRSASARYRWRFVAEAQRAAWMQWRAARPRRPRGWARLTARAAARLVAASALLAPVLLLGPRPDRALASPSQVALGALRAAGSAPSFGPPSTNPFGLEDVGDFATPTFADLDSDGDLDIAIGNSTGHTIIFQNTGSASAPAFAAPLLDPFGLLPVNEFARPTFADLDGDGDLDAFIGTYYGDTVYYSNTGSASTPAFSGPAYNPFGLQAVDLLSSPTFADLDGDGDLDAFIGEYYGDTIYFQNTGSASAPAFAAPVANPFALPSVDYQTHPTFADLDGDGDLDAFIGEFYGNTVYAQNTGSASAPAFAPSSLNPFSLGKVEWCGCPVFADLDADGDLDAFIGDGDGNAVFFENAQWTWLPLVWRSG